MNKSNNKQKKPDDTVDITVSSHIVIKDKTSNKVLIKQRG